MDKNETGSVVVGIDKYEQLLNDKFAAQMIALRYIRKTNMLIDFIESEFKDAQNDEYTYAMIPPKKWEQMLEKLNAMELEEENNGKII